MAAEMGRNRYGKGRVNVARVIHREGQDEYRNATVNVMLQGEFENAFLSGDNRQIVPTDTMKNTVWGYAAEHLADSIEDYGVALAQHFVRDFEQVTCAHVEMEEHLWRRITIRDRSEPYAFMGAGPEMRIATVDALGEELQIRAGFSDLPILKTRGSAFEAFTRDKFTTLWEAPERMLATEMSASWLYNTSNVDFDQTWTGARRILIETFVGHESRSMQHTLYTMGDAVLDEYSTIDEITLSLPNMHHFEVDLRPFGIRSDEVFFPVNNPHGRIEGTVHRSRV